MIVGDFGNCLDCSYLKKNIDFKGLNAIVTAQLTEFSCVVGKIQIKKSCKLGLVYLFAILQKLIIRVYKRVSLCLGDAIANRMGSFLVFYFSHKHSLVL